jgi:hypothetical protein
VLERWCSCQGEPSLVLEGRAFTLDVGAKGAIPRQPA